MQIDLSKLTAECLPIPEYEGYEADSNGDIWSVQSDWRGYGRRRLTQVLNRYG